MTALSSRWAGGSARALGSSGDEAVRLAIALGPMRSVIRVIDDNKPPMTVNWATVGTDEHGKPLSTSYTDFRSRRIAINPLPITRGSLDAGAAIDVVTGFAMHEASHSMHSRDAYRYLIAAKSVGSGASTEAPVFEPLRVAAYLLNLAEDPRVEQETAREWPGYAAYFDNLLDWMWNQQVADLPTEYGPDLAGQIKVAFLGVRYVERARTLLPAALQPEVEWWNAWSRDYLAGTTDVPTTIQRGLDHLREDEATATELDRMTAADKADREAGEKLREWLDRLIEEGILGTYNVCSSSSGATLDEYTAERVDQLVKEQLQEVRAIITADGCDAPTIRVTRPEDTYGSRRAYAGRPDALTEAYRAALVFRSERPQYDIKLQRSGILDDEELYRFGMGDDRLFSERVIETRPDTAFGMLVDLSGSMDSGMGSGRSRLDVAQRLAQLFLWALHDMEGVTTRVWGHTGDGEAGRGADIFRIWEPGDPLTRLGLIQALDHSNNYDGYALGYCADRMRELPQPQKVLVVLSDGYPSGSGYGGVRAQQHVRRVTDWARGQGVEVIQIAIDTAIRHSDQEAMFGPANYVIYESEKQLPRDLARILGRFTR